MPLNTVTMGNTILAADVNQLVNVLQRAAGQTEVGHYVLAGADYAANAFVSMYMPSLSRGATPVSVSIDTADIVPSGGMGTPSTGVLTAGGFQIFNAPVAANLNPRAGGNYTIQY